MKRKIDYHALILISSMFGVMFTWLTNIDNFISCWQTSQYQVWVCNTNTSYYLFYLFAIIWLCYAIYFIYDLIFEKQYIHEIEIK